jgi:peroxiredoxin
MQRGLDELRASGIMDRVARVGQTAPDFTLPDDLREIYLKFGIDLARGNDDGTWRLPVPARFVIDRQSVIRAVDADPDDTRRSEPARTVEILAGLRARPSGKERA